MKRFIYKIDIEFTPKDFWSILPTININIKSKELELEWLCIGIYIRKKVQKEEIINTSEPFVLNKDTEFDIEIKRQLEICKKTEESLININNMFDNMIKSNSQIIRTLANQNK